MGSSTWDYFHVPNIVLLTWNTSKNEIIILSFMEILYSIKRGQTKKVKKKIVILLKGDDFYAKEKRKKAWKTG